MGVNKPTDKVIVLWLAIALAIGYWPLEALVHAVLIGKDTFSGQLFAPDPNELWMRIIISVLIIWFGIYASRMIHRQRDQAAKLARLNRLLRFLSEVNQHVQRLRQPQEMFEGICHAAVELAGFRFAWVGHYDQGTRCLRPVAQAAFAEACGKAMQSALIAKRHVPSTRADLPWASGKPAYCDLLASVDCKSPWKEPLIRNACRSAAAFPILVRNKPVATLTVYAGDESFFRKKEIGLLEEAADDISYALTKIEHEKQQRQSEEMLKSRLEELERFQKATIQREFRIKELRDEIAALKARLDDKR
jgi:GAF domain-containing protein